MTLKKVKKFIKQKKYLLVSLAFLGVLFGTFQNCGKNTGTATPETAKFTANTTSTNGNSVIASSSSSSTSSTSSSSSSTAPCHPVVTYATPFTTSLSRSSSDTATFKQTAFNVVGVDQDLKVQITPGNDSGANPYTKFGATVTLLRQGGSPPTTTVVTASTTILPNVAGTTGPKGGIAVGQKSAIIDFSQWTIPGYTYAIRLSDINTNYTCLQYCTENYYWNQCLTQYGYWSCYYNYSNLVLSMVNSFKQMQCDIGPITAGRGWSATVQVETDNTPCLTP